MSDTPRTDHAISVCRDVESLWGCQALIELSRNLERALNKMRAQRDEAVKTLAECRKINT